MKLTPAQIREIAQELDTGMTCYVHKQSLEIECIPDMDAPFFDLEPWEEIIDKIQGNRSDYFEFEGMDSHQAFQVMQDFADELPDQKFKDKLFKALSWRKPFANFKWLIDESDYRQNWFDFKQAAMEAWVHEQIPKS